MMTGAAVIVAWMVFQSIAANMTTFSETRIPVLRNSAQVVSAADRTRGLLADILVARSPEDLAKLEFKKMLIIEDLEEATAAISSDGSSTLITAVAEVKEWLKALSLARDAEFDIQNTVASYVKEAMSLATDAGNLLEEGSDTAFFDLILGGDQTIERIDATLSNLIDQDFAAYQIALEIRSEVNLLSGLALSVAQTRDPSMTSILNDVAQGSNQRLIKLLERLAGTSDFADLATTIEAARDVFARSFTSGQARLAFGEILAARQDVDAALSSALDDIYFDLVITGDDAKSENETSVRQLLDGEVTTIREKAALDSAAKTYFAAVLQAALARDPVELGLRADDLTVAATRLMSNLNGSSVDIHAKLHEMLKFSDPQSGMIETRAAAFEAQASAALATRNATDAVRKIAGLTSEYSLTAQDGIDMSANALKTEVLEARDLVQTLGLASALLVLAAPFFIWLMVTRPLNRVTALTERLAKGDLSEIEGTSARGGEIGRLFRALEVFRDGALERIRMQREEKTREALMQETQRKADQQQHEMETREREAAALLEQQERDREAEAQARDEAARKVTDAERKARADEQAAVVASLARSLKGLSEGDLTHVINEKFPESYEALRLDYNAAIRNLARLIRKIGDSSSLIDDSSTEISASSLDLSRRTESAAATLEETAAALSELTASVASAANGASNASTTVELVKKDAEDSSQVMLQAVTAMSEIENSSGEIAKIVEVIDAISFQTNLLALNAGVEAARAGEEGRGFAVVASEVRQLAHRCSDAALQINTLISGSSEHVQKGVRLIDQTNKALEVILNGISNVAQNVSEIAAASREQSSGIAEINVAIEQLDRSTQRNAAMFEETTAASQVLTSEAGQLSHLVAEFKIAQSSEKEWAGDDHGAALARSA